MLNVHNNYISVSDVKYEGAACPSLHLCYSIKCVHNLKEVHLYTHVCVCVCLSYAYIYPIVKNTLENRKMEDISAAVILYHEMMVFK